MNRYKYKGLQNIYEEYSIGNPKMQRVLSFQPVEDWLRCLGLLHYAQRFYDNGYEDLETCKLIEETDLNAIEMTDKNDREDILIAVQHLKRNTQFVLKSDDSKLIRTKIEKKTLKKKLKELLKRDNRKLTVSWVCHTFD